ncbi:group II intron reverse transcriptase/maturase [Chroococcidiopsis cubana]|uniref:group II intron reverse transcriptase/maturase n=6 Tax=Chroococcidiopsis cubana TaxID=171392 RepID=UPI002ACE0FFB|nr:group II intron reverse transcriptase/maturase [Chroococcidiopsis cubana]
MNKAKTRQFADLLLKRCELPQKGFIPLKKKPIRKVSDEKSTVEWRNVDWQKLEKRIFKLQKRIYRASSRGDVKAVRRLQKTLMKSWSAKMLAVRRVTQDNQGKATAGIDGVKKLTPKQRLELIPKLRLNRKAKPTRRVWIPKPGTDEKRPLGIPTMYDRALQALVKLALEPEWEARFEQNSYGFRPGRSCHDAIEAIFKAISQKSKYVLDADISKCFDRINHKALLEKLNTFPTIRQQIRAWLQAGVMDNGQLFPTAEGTPQGGVISPLLANIALHGMENRIKQFAETLPGKKRENRSSLSLIRYADDFVIIHKDITVVKKCQQTIADWLKGMGLELNPSKTRITHTLKEYEGQKPGFDFLGFTIRQYPVGKYHTGKDGSGMPLGFKTIIKPSPKKIKLHAENVRSIIRTNKTASQHKLISQLNPVIRGWTKYYSTVVSKEIFTGLNHLTYKKLRAWAKRRHSKKNASWIVNRYWLVDQGEGWEFANKGRGKQKFLRLIKHAETPIIRHIKVEDRRSPYDGELVYWSTRMGRHPEVPKNVATLLKRQKGKCAHCGLTFKDGDLKEKDHIIPRYRGGIYRHQNLQLLHRHCHDKKTAQDAVGNKRTKTKSRSPKPKSGQ